MIVFTQSTIVLCKYSIVLKIILFVIIFPGGGTEFPGNSITFPGSENSLCIPGFFQVCGHPA